MNLRRSGTIALSWGILLNICERLQDEYEKEATEHGFPFNFDLREMHRRLKGFLAGHTATESDDG